MRASSWWLCLVAVAGIAACSVESEERLTLGSVRSALGESVQVDKPSYAVGEAVVVSFVQPTPAPLDWVALAPVGAPYSSFKAWAYTNGLSSGSRSLAVPAAGQYVARLFANDGYTLLAESGSFAVISPVSVATNASSYTPGASMSVSFNSPVPSARDWVALAPAGSPNTSFLQWSYTSGAATGSLSFTAPTTLGPYVARLFENDGYNLLAESSFTVSTGPSIATSASSYAEPTTVPVTFANLPGNARDWVSIAPSGSPLTTFSSFAYTNGAASGTLSLNTSGFGAGAWVARAYSNDSYTLIAQSSPFTITVDRTPLVQTNSATYAQNAPIVVSFENMTGATTDWVALAFHGSAPRDYVSWKYVGPQINGSTTFTQPLSSGRYVARAFANDSLTMLAESAPFDYAPTSEPTPTCSGTNASGGGPAASGFRWAQQYGCGANANAVDNATDAAGNIYVLASLNGTVDFGTGQRTSAGHDDVLLAKLDPQGHALWTRRVGDQRFQHAIGLTADETGNVIVGVVNAPNGSPSSTIDPGLGAITSTLSELIVYKVDTNGSTLWQRRFGHPSDVFGQVTAGSQLRRGANGGAVISGAFNGTVDFGSGPVTANLDDGYALALDAGGNYLWAHTFDGYPTDALGDANGNVVVVARETSASGCFIRRYSPTGVVASTQTYSNCTPLSVAFDSSQNLVVGAIVRSGTNFAGVVPPTSQPSTYWAVAKFSTANTPVWAKAIVPGTNGSDPMVTTRGEDIFINAYGGTTPIGKAYEWSHGAFVARLTPGGVLASFTWLGYARTASPAAVFTGNAMILTGSYFQNYLSFDSAVLSKPHTDPGFFIASMTPP